MWNYIECICHVALLHVDHVSIVKVIQLSDTCSTMVNSCWRGDVNLKWQVSRHRKKIVERPIIIKLILLLQTKKQYNRNRHTHPNAMWIISTSVQAIKPDGLDWANNFDDDLYSEDLFVLFEPVRTTCLHKLSHLSWCDKLEKRSITSRKNKQDEGGVWHIYTHTTSGCMLNEWHIPMLWCHIPVFQLWLLQTCVCILWVLIN